MISKIVTVLFVVFISVMTSISAQNKERDYTESAIRPKDFNSSEWNELKLHRADPQWLKDVRFGIWCHWGIPSLAGNDNNAFGWYGKHMYRKGQKEYDYHLEKYGHDVHYHDLIPMFKGEKFDAKVWLELFQAGGAKMAGVMGEHHDGFSMWDSKVNPWNATKMGPKRDIVKEFSEEAKRRDLRLVITLHHGFHELFFPRAQEFEKRYESKWSIPEKAWHPPLDKKYSKLYSSYMTEDETDQFWHDKVMEVMNSYHPDYIYTDFGPRFIDQDTRIETVTEVFKKASSENRDMIFNTKGSTFPEEMAIRNVEQAVLPNISDRVWYVDFTLTPGWFFAGNDRLSHAADTDFYKRVLIDIVSKNGVMALSFGPKPDGTIPAKHEAVIRDIGRWLTVVGEGVYSTLPFYVCGEGNVLGLGEETKEYDEHGISNRELNKLGENSFRFTRKGNTVYLFSLKYSKANKPINIKSFGGELMDYFKIKSVTLMGSDEKVEWKQDEKGLHLKTPAISPTHDASPYAFKIELADNFIYEAESVKVNKPLFINKEEVASQGKCISGLEKQGAHVDFEVEVPVAGNYRVVVHYKNQGNSFIGANKFLNVDVNETKSQKVCFYASEEDTWQTTFVRVKLNKGKNIIYFKNEESKKQPFLLDKIAVLPIVK